MRTSSQIICASCGGRIRESEPDLALRKLDSPEPLRFFHTRCGDAARRISLDADPDVWLLTVRHVYEEEI